MFVALRARTVVVVFSTGQFSKEITANDDNDKILSRCRPATGHLSPSVFRRLAGSGRALAGRESRRCGLGYAPPGCSSSPNRFFIATRTSSGKTRVLPFFLLFTFVDKAASRGFVRTNGTPGHCHRILNIAPRFARV